MVMIPQTFNVADLPETGGNTVLIPQGQYKAVIVSSEFKDTKDRQGKYLALKIVLTEGVYANTEFTERLNLINNNQKAVEIAYKTLARISEAVGMTQTPSDSTQLHNKPFLVDIVTEEGDQKKDENGKLMFKADGKEDCYPDKSIIKKYHKLSGNVQSAPFGGQPAPQAVGAVPWK